MVKVKKVPVRMCIACREKKLKKEMARIVKNSDGEISLDLSGKKSGRGAYICDSLDCVKKLSKNRLLNRAFACEIDKSVYLKLEEEFGGGK